MENLGVLLQKKKGIILGGTFLGLLAGLAAPFLITPQFKTSAVVSISPKYFQHPLVRDFLSETYDTSELRSQRDALLRQAFDQKFLDELSVKLGLNKENETPIQTADRRMSLARSIEVVPLQATEYQISALYSDRETALRIANEATASLSRTMKSERLKLLGSLRGSVSNQIRTLLSGGESSIGHGSTQEEESQVALQLAQARQKYAEAHPLVQQLKNRQNTLKVNEPSLARLSAPKDAAQKAVYEDLVRKLNYLNVALDMEARETPYYFNVVKSPELPVSAIWPRRPLFLLWGFFLGFFAALAWVIGREGLRGVDRSAPLGATVAGAGGLSSGRKSLDRLVREFDELEPPAK